MDFFPHFLESRSRRYRLRSSLRRARDARSPINPTVRARFPLMRRRYLSTGTFEIYYLERAGREERGAIIFDSTELPRAMPWPAAKRGRSRETAERRAVTFEFPILRTAAVSFINPSGRRMEGGEGTVLESFLLARPFTRARRRAIDRRRYRKVRLVARNVISNRHAV